MLHQESNIGQNDSGMNAVKPPLTPKEKDSRATKGIFTLKDVEVLHPTETQQNTFYSLLYSGNNNSHPFLIIDRKVHSTIMLDI